MKIIWVNHASFIFEHSNIRLICDPWLSGTAFNEGWHLLAETKFKLKDFSQITHIWISHEHPDHFSPATLKKIPKNLIENTELDTEKARLRSLSSEGNTI